MKTKVIGQITSLIIKHEKVIATLNEEVFMLKNLVQNMALQLINNFSKEVESNVKEQNQDNDNNKGASPEHVFKCEKCDYKAEKEIMLKKHMNTKHIEQKSQIEVKKLENRVNFTCYECDFTSKTKKNLKKHKEKHHGQDVNKESSIANIERNPMTEILSTCQCTPETVCDECLAEWIPKEKLVRKIPHTGDKESLNRCG